MSALIPALKNEHTKRILCVAGIRPPAARHSTTAHCRMPALAGWIESTGARSGLVRLLRSVHLQRSWAKGWRV